MIRLVLTASITLTATAAVARPIDPEAHHRYSPNAAYFLRFDPKTDRHTVHASDAPEDAPVHVVWTTLSGGNIRGGNLTRDGQELHVKTFGARSFTFSIDTGRIIGWSINPEYFLYFGLVYCIPVTVAIRRFRSLRQAAAGDEVDEDLKLRFRRFLTQNVGGVLVAINSMVFGIGVQLNYFGGFIDQLGATFCIHTYSLSLFLIPVTIVISIIAFITEPRRVDVTGPWLAVMSHIVIVAVVDMHTI